MSGALWKASASRRRVHTPTVLQMEAVECGAAALAIVLSYHGRHVPLEALRVACGVSRDGSKASNLAKAARSYGLEARGLKREPHELGELRLPFIVFWNFNHFLVVEGFGRGVVHLNDPATGPRTVSSAEFDEAFTGVALDLAPGPAFQKGGRRPSLVAALGPRLRGSGLALLYVVLAGLLLVVPGLLVPTFSRVFIDEILVGGALRWTVPLLLCMGLCALTRGALAFLTKRYLGRFETKLALVTASRFLWHVLRLPVEFFQQRYTGDIGSRVMANDRLARLLSGDLSTNLINLLMIVFYGGLMLAYDRMLCLLGVLMAALNFAAMRWVSRRRVDQNQRMLQDRGKLAGVAMGGMKIIETLKASGAEGDFFARWSGYQARVLHAEQQLGAATQLLQAVPPLLFNLSTIAVLGLGALRVMDGQLSIGQLVAFQTLMTCFLLPVGQMVRLGATLQEVQGDMCRLDDVLQHEEDPVFRQETPAAPPAVVRLRGQVELRGVTFGYSRVEEPLIKDFSLLVRPGSRVALVGSSGSGKSTVAKLVTGLYQPWEGEILLDGVPRRGLPRHLLTHSLAMVDQDIFLFEGTVRDNLTLWDPTVPEAQIVGAARDAAIHDEITVRPGGYDALVDEDGRNFSGGQRQRLELGRALVQDPAVLVLDEATSALDPLTEVLVDRNLRRRNCTCIIIAHRLSTIRDCDEIIFLERGRVAERGTHEELLASGGPYARLVQTS